MQKETVIRQSLFIGRDDWIRTSDPLHPMQVRYRAALRPVLNRGAKIAGTSIASKH